VEGSERKQHAFAYDRLIPREDTYKADRLWQEGARSKLLAASERGFETDQSFISGHEYKFPEFAALAS
jgi:hypothetical protein